jgi:hypothetical protein
VTVPAGGAASTTFEVSCAPIPDRGDLTVTTRTNGADLDADGYRFNAVGPEGNGVQGAAIATNGSFTISRVLVGDYIVTLTGIAANCSVNGENPRTVTVTPDAITTTFDVLCLPIPRRLAFAVQPHNAAPFMAIRPPVEVVALDDAGNPVESFIGPVTVAISHNAGLWPPATLRGTLTVNAANGYARFSDLNIDQPGIGYKLWASSPGLTPVESVPFTILTPMPFP